ncbi:hypothetical protein D4R89_10245 [bacterium]|nr:MAG: hypothetical protein D4R89_10245 [bacterium]
MPWKNEMPILERVTMPGPHAGRKPGRLLIVPFIVLLAFAAVGAPSRAVAKASYTPPAPEDFSALSWTQAFNRLHAKMSREYAFTAWKRVNWRALYREYGPRIAKAEAANDEAAYYLGLRGYIHELRDGHVGIKAADLAAQQTMTEAQRRIVGGGFGLIATRLDDSGVIVSWVKPNGPAARAGMRVGARLLTWRGAPVAQALARTSTVLGPSQPTFARTMYEQARFLVRAPIGATRTVSFRNRGEGAYRTVRLRAVDDGLETLAMTDASSILNFGWPERMVEHRILPGNVGYVRIYAEIDLPEQLPGDHTPTLELFRAAIGEFIDANVAGVVVDIRSNSGGSDQMAADFLASFYDRTTFYEYQNYIVPATGAFEIWIADDATGEYMSPGEGISIEPAARRYAGPVVALVNNGCISSGEGVAMGIKNLPNGRVVGFSGTNGSFGMSGDVALMPGGYVIDWPFGQSLDERKVVQIDTRDGRGGVRPDARVPMTRSNALRVAGGEDVALEYGLRELGRMRQDL